MAAAPPSFRSPPAPAFQGLWPPWGHGAGHRDTCPGQSGSLSPRLVAVCWSGPGSPRVICPPLSCPRLTSVSLGLEAAAISHSRPLSRTSLVLSRARSHRRPAGGQESGPSGLRACGPAATRLLLASTETVLFRSGPLGYGLISLCFVLIKS